MPTSNESIGPSSAISRRTALKQCTSATLLASGSLSASAENQETKAPQPIRALKPRDGSGVQFVSYSDCCSGIPNGRFEGNLQRMNQMVVRIRPRPEFIAFPGDAISGYITNYDDLRKQWDYWQKTEMKWLAGRNIPLFQSTSNHNTYDDGSEQVFREKHPDLPKNGPSGQKGLAYYVRRGDVLYVSTHQPDRVRFPNYRPGMLIDWKWLDRVLTEHKTAKYKLVAGHYPVFPVNGYVQYPLWCLKPEERKPFWDVLAKHRVDAYLGSHVIAFDVQVHDGVPQIVSGGAGTNYGPGGFMPGRTEYLHAVQLALDALGLRYQVLDVAGKVRESLQWPFALPPADQWTPLSAKTIRAEMSPKSSAGKIVSFRFQGQLPAKLPANRSHTMLCGYDSGEGVATVWAGFEGDPQRLTIRLVPESTFGVQRWLGPEFKTEAEFDFQVALHLGMGPGGILYRENEKSAWSSLMSTSPRGIERLQWPRNWTIASSQSGPTDRPFLGTNLSIHATRRDVPSIW